MKTTCEHCLFKTENVIMSFADGDIHVQTGCKLGQLEKFEKTLVKNPKGTHYELLGLCRPCRNENWHFYQDNPDASFEILKQQALNESIISYDIVVAHHFEDTVESSIQLLKSIKELKIKPKKISFITNKTFEESKQLYIDIVPHSDVSVKIEISGISENLFDLLASGVIQPTKSQFILCCLDGTEIRNADIEKVNEIANSPKGFLLALFEEYYIGESRVLNYVGKQTVELVGGTTKLLKEQGKEELIYNGFQS